MMTQEQMNQRREELRKNREQRALILKRRRKRRITHPEANSDRISVGSLFSVKLISHDDEIVFIKEED